MVRKMSLFKYCILFIFHLFVNRHITDAVVAPLDPDCLQPIGMESGDIPDSSIKTGDGAVTSGQEGYYGRLNNDKEWCIPNVVNHQGPPIFNREMYIQIKLPARYQITAIALQGGSEKRKQYTYGDVLRIYYEYHRDFILHKVDNNDNIKVHGYFDDKIDFVALTPPIYSHILRINMASDSNVKCARIELYGCAQEYNLKEYRNCFTTNNSLLTTDIPKENFIQKSFASSKNALDAASHILFESKDAWCILQPFEDGQEFNNYAQVELGKPVLIYAAQVRGLVAGDKPDVSSVKRLAASFRLEFSAGNDQWVKVNAGESFPSRFYVSSRLEFPTPFVARLVRIRIENDYPNRTCIKLQLYGCDAKLTSEITTTPFTLPPTNPNSTVIPEARVLRYTIPQGNEYSSTIVWKDTKYTKEVSLNNYLTGGTGCLLDENVRNNPFEYPDCWIGWKKSVNSNPWMSLILTRRTTITAVLLQIYINESMGASTFNDLRVALPRGVIGKVCAPSSYYHVNPKTEIVLVDLNNVNTQELTLMFSYVGTWLLVRRVKILQGNPVNVNVLPLVHYSVACKIPTKEEVEGTNNSPSTILIIVCIILGLLFLGLLACVIYRYRKGLHKFILKRPPKSIIVETAFDRRQLLNNSRNSERNTSLNGHERNTSLNGHPNGRLDYTKVAFNNDANDNDDVYAAPDITPSSPNRKGYTQVAIQDYAQYTHPDLERGQSGTLEYAQPTQKGSQQYALPNEAPKTNPIYQGSVIYAAGYQSPYKAILGSSLYCEPEKVVKKKSYKTFPREQLKFKEQIGSGQFGEVWIAEASGLEVIYDTIGHFSSWGSPDTGKVAVKKLKDSADKEIEEEFMKEVQVMSQLTNENVVRLLGICNERSPLLMVVEYMENGDLNQFLMDRKPCVNENYRVSQMEPNILTIDTLIHMAAQVAEGLKYLHSEGFIHRDLATRNCLVGPAFQVKISDFGMSRYLYSKHYYRVEGKVVLPIRWMAPECLYYGKFTATTDIWSFGVTLWEIFNFARNSPYQELNDPQVIEKLCKAVENPKIPFGYLGKPNVCDDEMYELMCKCWQTLPEDRPTIAHIAKTLKEKSESSEDAI